MKRTQQKETKAYFERHAHEWEKRGKGLPERVNIIKQRNDFVLEVARARSTTKTALDIGCGTGDLVCALAEQGIDATGIDFAPDMIARAQTRAKTLRLNLNRGAARFACASIFTLPLAPDGFDLISANGFIEYIAYQELDALLALARRALAHGGSLVLGSRNRLFNLFSGNQFTQDECDAGTVEALLRETALIAGAKNIKTLKACTPAPLQKEEKKHARTGVTVSTRYQFTPAQLAKRLTQNGFRTDGIFPIHIHAAPPAFKTKHPLLHVRLSNLLHEYAEEDAFALIPHASSFMIHAKKVH